MKADDENENAETTVPMTTDRRRALRAEITRTGLTAIMLFENARGLPEGLDARTVNRWIGGLTKAASKRDLDHAMMLWSKLPDDPGRMTSDGRRLSRRGARHAGENETRIVVTPTWPRVFAPS